MPFLHWMLTWWAAVALGLCSAIALLASPVSFHRKRFGEAYLLLFSSVFIFPALILVATPLLQVIPLAWTVALCLTILLLTFITLFSYARTMRAIRPLERNVRS